MSENELKAVLAQLQGSPNPALLSKAKLILLKLNALVPSPKTPTSTLLLARSVLEHGALSSILQKDTDAFVRYFQQLQPFYDLPTSTLPTQNSGQSKVTGIYLLLLLSQGDYAGFHTVLESLEMTGGEEGKSTKEDRFIEYPVKLEQWLMEGSYDKVWATMKSSEVPSVEFGIFEEVLTTSIRQEIATSAQRAYPSLPISNAKNLLFLPSEGAVISFAESMRWQIKDGRIYFPVQQEQGVRNEREILEGSGMVIENTLGYARELETIV